MSGKDKQEESALDEKANYTPIGTVATPKGKKERRKVLDNPALAEKRALQKAKHEFRTWKKSIARIITAESEMVRNADGSYSFVLPARLTKLVYEVMIREHVKMKGCTRDEAEKVVRRGFVETTEKYEKAVSANQEALDNAEAALGRPLEPGETIKTPLGVATVRERTPGKV